MVEQEQDYALKDTCAHDQMVSLHSDISKLEEQLLEMEKGSAKRETELKSYTDELLADIESRNNEVYIYFLSRICVVVVVLNKSNRVFGKFAK